MRTPNFDRAFVAASELDPVPLDKALEADGSDVEAGDVLVEAGDVLAEAVPYELAASALELRLDSSSAAIDDS
jgi:molybdopterin biosynthesis enzyme